MSKVNTFYKKHPIVSTLLIMCLVSVIVLFIVVKMTNLITHHGHEYDCPDLIGKNSVELNDFLENKNENNFQIVIIDSVFASDKKGGVVLSQDPSANSKIKGGRKIYITTSAITAPKVEMPNLIDLSLRQAENLLETNHLKVGQIIYKESKYINAVLEQLYLGRMVEAGKMIPYNSKITLVVGKEGRVSEEIIIEE